MNLFDLLNEQFSPTLPDGVKMRTSERDTLIVLDMISVPEDQRGSGIFKSLVGSLLKYADRNNKTVALTASSDFGASKPKLEKFYMSMGFVKNIGKNKDYEISEGMYRLPRSITEGIDYTTGKKQKEIKLPIYTTTKFDYGSRSNNIQRGDIVVKASNTGNIYGRRATVQRTLKKRSK